MKSRYSLLLGMVAMGLYAATAFAVDTNWTNELQTITVYEGDTYGTVCHDIYIDSSNTLVNYQSQGLNFCWRNAGGGVQSGYIRFDNWMNNIPAGSFIYKADLILTASSNSVGQGYLFVAARAAYTFDEATVTYSTMTLPANPAPMPSWGSSQGRYGLFWHLYGTNLTPGAVATISNITPAVRAWYDQKQNSSWGYTNAGFYFNYNAWGHGGITNNLVCFYDSENANTNNRPKLRVQYLPPTSNYKAYIYQATDVSSNTAQIRKLSPEDAYIRAADRNAGRFGGFTNCNFGGHEGPVILDYGDGYISSGVYDVSAPANVYGRELIRWRGWSYPMGNIRVADVRLRVQTGCNQGAGEDAVASVQVLKCMKNWVEGTGRYANASAPWGTSQTNVTWCNFDVSADTNLALNAWEKHGASGPTDSTNLYTFTIGDPFGEVLSSDTNGLLVDLVQSWLDGVGENDGLILTSSGRAMVEHGRFHKVLPSAYLQFDPYQTAGFLVVYKILSGTLIFTR